MKINKRNIFIGVLTVFLLWSISGLIIHFMIEDRGTFGDMFGSINALFSGLALFGIIISILIQQNELNLQREELKDTRMEFVTSRITNILFKQLDYLNKQIDRMKFYPSRIINQDQGMSIDEFILYLSSFRNAGNMKSVYTLMEVNETQIISLSTKITSILVNVSEILKESHMDKNIVVQMRRMFKKNINPSVIPILIDRIASLRKNYKVEDEMENYELDKLLKKIDDTLISLEVQRINIILNFDKEDFDN